MARLTRAQTQRLNRDKVLAAAREEFAEHGFRDAKIDRIAERAELTRGAVYSNFPGKRALYFAVLADVAERTPEALDEPGRTPREALGALARAWLARLPLSTDEPAVTRLGRDLMPEVVADERVRRPYAQLLKLDAILLGLALERLHHRPARLVRVAETALTTLHGASQLAAAAPGFVEPFDVVRACERLADLDLDDGWPPPHVAHAPPPRSVDEPWTPAAATDCLRDRPADLAGDGVLAILGVHRLAAVEEAIRVTPEVTLVIVTGTPAELAPLTRLVLAELRSLLRQAVPASAWPKLRVVRDDDGTLAAAAGVPAVSDATEAAVRVRDGRIVARAEGYGACHSVASS